MLNRCAWCLQGGGAFAGVELVCRANGTLPVTSHQQRASSVDQSVPEASLGISHDGPALIGVCLIMPRRQGISGGPVLIRACLIRLNSKHGPLT